MSTCDTALYNTDLVLYDGADCNDLQLLECNDNAILCGVIMIFRPEEEVDWPGPGAIIKIAISVIVMIAYAYSLKPFGFLLPTTLAAGILSYLITPRLTFNIIAGISLAVGLYILFRYGLGLETLRAIPKAWGA